jgi:hypothetical protein
MSNDPVGVGFSEDQDSFEAGKLASAQAMARRGRQGGSLALAFCTGKHDYQACFDGVRSEAGDIPVIGGAAIGVITNEHLGYEGYQVGVAVLPDDLSIDISAAGGLDKGEKAVGLKLGRRLSAKRDPREELALLFYDSVRSSPPPSPVLNVSSYLIEGFEEGIGEDPPLTVGAGLIGSYAFDEGKVFCGTKVASQHAVAALLSCDDCTIYSTIMHGCKPMSDYHAVTRVDGPIVYEIDGEPAMDVIDRLLGSQEWQRRLPLLVVTLGVNHGERYGPFNEKNYVNRLVVGAIPEEKAIVLFEADFEDGTEFQFMRRNAALMEESADEASREAMTYHREHNLEPFFALYIDCAGRTAGFSGAEREEASIIQANMGEHVPLLGFYSGVEIAPLLGKSRGLDWTGVLLVSSRSKE